MTSRETMIAQAGELIAQRAAAGSGNYCTVVGVGPDGYPVSTTISISKCEGIRWLTFCTGAGAPTALRAREGGKACVCLNSPEYHIGLVGDLTVCTDPETRREMWYEGLSQHFSGPEDENYCVLRFTTRRYSLFVGWDSVKGEIED